MKLRVVLSFALTWLLTVVAAAPEEMKRAEEVEVEAESEILRTSEEARQGDAFGKAGSISTRIYAAFCEECSLIFALIY